MPRLMTAATRVLRLTFEPSASSRDASHPSRPLIDFVAYGHEAMLAGRLPLDADRLTDLLNASDEVELVDVVSLNVEGDVVETDLAVVRRRELVAVKAGNPRGRPSLRKPTRQSAVLAGAGRHVMHGYIHHRPGADPMIDVGRRAPMIPLTEATIAYQTPSGWRRDRASTLIVNRDTADWLRPAKEDDLARLVAQTSAA